MYCEDCNTEMELEVLMSAAGYYLGYQCLCGPYDRVSGYYKRKEEADAVLHELKDFEPAKK